MPFMPYYFQRQIKNITTKNKITFQNKNKHNSLIIKYLNPKKHHKKTRFLSPFLSEKSLILGQKVLESTFFAHF